jgi:hypothetical protein
LGWVDTPQDGARLSGSLAVSGWVINEGLGVDRVEVQLNGVTIGSADYGQPRPDVVAAMYAEDDPNAPMLGFTLALDSATLPAGRARLRIKTTGKSGEVQYFGDRTVVLE